MNGVIDTEIPEPLFICRKAALDLKKEGELQI